MARTVITAFEIVKACRVRVAGALDKNDEGTCAFVAGGKVYDNSKYDGSWHKFPEGTKFEVACLVDKTDTYCLLAKEKISEVVVDEEGNETTVTRTETNGVFLRRLAYEKLLKHAEATILEDTEPKAEVEFGTPAADVEIDAKVDVAIEEEVDADDALLDELVAEVDEMDLIEEEGPSDDELAAIEAEMAA